MAISCSSSSALITRISSTIPITFLIPEKIASILCRKIFWDTVHVHGKCLNLYLLSSMLMVTVDSISGLIFYANIPSLRLLH